MKKCPLLSPSVKFTSLCRVSIGRDINWWHLLNISQGKYSFSFHMV